MWFAVISSISCFALAVLLFASEMWDDKFVQTISFYFLFQGSWILFSFVSNKIWSQIQFINIAGYIGTLIFSGYLFYYVKRNF